MKGNDIERQTILDMKGLIMNDEMKQSIRVMTDFYIIAVDEAIKQGEDTIAAKQIAMAVIVAMLNNGGTRC